MAEFLESFTLFDVQLCNTNPAPADGTGALTGTGNTCPTVGSIATVPIFHQGVGAFAFHFPTQSIYFVDVDTLRRIE